MPPVDVTRRRNGRVTPEKVATVQRRAFVHAIEHEKLSREGAAREMGVRRYTVQRYANGGLPVNERKVYSSRRMWRSYHNCMGTLMRKLWGAA